MQVVIIGSRERKTPEERTLVFSLMELLKQKYRNLVIVSSACDQGIGKFVKERCLEQKDKTRPDFAFVEFQIKIWAKLTRERLAVTYMSRNATLLELGDEFHVFVTANRKSGLEDLIRKAEASSKPVYIYTAGTKTISLSDVKAQEPLLSSEIRELLNTGEVTEF